MWRTPPLAPGTSYVKLDAGLHLTVGLVGPTSTYVTYAAGCPGSLGVCELVPRDTPRIGRPLTVQMNNLPANVAVLAFGWNRTAAVSLATLGMPGCNAYLQPDAWALCTGQNGSATYDLPIPNAIPFVGLRFYHQAMVPDPTGGTTALGAVMSNAAEAVVGR